ncbi:hypothetical protein EIP91_000043 [Steccherinum ochraceum]|uniref:Major facilitator superfamily (MFS) profile domain-containing protein n=1 Tax=Steccherinum ochraceum TaxID=92696 RepID=A0A4R0RSR2_9APHY|nr:hypothetical protein EIP91_000043 [Steccherinum ochraceum]
MSATVVISQQGETHTLPTLSFRPQPPLNASRLSLNTIAVQDDDADQGSPGPATPPGQNYNVETIEMAELGPRTSSSSGPPPVVFPAASTKTRRTATIQFVALCWTLFLAGWNDGSTGPLLPRMRDAYHIGFGLVSLIFVFNCLGCITGAAANVYLTDRYGFGKVMVIGATAQVASFAINSPAPPYPVLVLGYAINGFGIAIQDAGANGYVASLKSNASVKMGLLHAVYGAGAFAAPLVSTQFASMSHWSLHYLTSLGVAVINLVALIAVFRFKRQEECLIEIGQPPVETSTTASGQNLYKEIFKLKALHLFGFFVLTYVGVEVTIGGWIVEYAMDVRGGGLSSGYISSGFFGGLMLGRVSLLWVNKLVGERRVIYVYVLLAIVLELVIWLVPSLIGGAVAVSFVGVVLGPIYPIVMNHSARVLPPRLLTGAIGWIAGFGQAGSAFLPFLTGTLASSKGIQSLQPLTVANGLGDPRLVAMMGVMLVLWIFVPSSSRRDD